MISGFQPFFWVIEFYYTAVSVHVILKIRNKEEDKTKVFFNTFNTNCRVSHAVFLLDTRLCPNHPHTVGAKLADMFEFIYD